MKNSVSKALLWKLLERFGVQGVQFVLQIILARLLDPSLYGVLSLMVVFTALADVFIQRGFNTALIQGKDVGEEDYSSVFWVSLSIAGILYGLLYLAAPVIAALYQMPDLVWPFRVLCLMLIPGAMNSVQLAKVSREMDFVKVFKSSLSGIIASGIVGITCAYLGLGLWALVFQSLTNVTVNCIVMLVTVKWRPRLLCRWDRICLLFSYGWKLLVSSLLNTLSQDIQSLVIGLKYRADTLGFFNRGKQFPQFVINAVNGSVQSVLLPAMSARQDEKEKVKILMRNSVMLSSFIIFPMMAGLAAVAPALVELLLTEKWLPCVPYMQVFCVSLAFYPVHTSNLQAINAVGRSDIYLMLETVKKVLSLLVLAVAVLCFESPMAIALSAVVTSVVNSFINASPNKKLIGYSYPEQIKDILPSLALAVLMFGAVTAVGTLALPAIALLAVQVVTGVAVYAVPALALRLEPVQVLLKMMKKKPNGK